MVEAGLPLATVALLVLAATLAAALDAVAGGGGLLTVPALLLAGLDPVAAIATNKAQGAAGALSSTFAFARRGFIPWREAAPAALFAASGGLAGALAAHLSPRALLEAAIPALLIAVALYFLRPRALRAEDSAPRLGPLAFAASAALAIGAYDGAFGPGAGSFYLLAFAGLRGLGALRATGCVKLANAASNIAALSLFALAGAVVWPVGLAMAAGAVAGAQVGARLAIRFGARAIRPLIVLVSLAMAARLLADPGNPLTASVLRLLGR